MGLVGALVTPGPALGEEPLPDPAEVLVPGQSPVPFEPDAVQANQAGQAAGGPAGGTSYLVHLAPGANRGPIRQFATDRGGHVKYEYSILPNLINIRGIPAVAVNALGQIPGVVRIELDGTVQAHMNDSTPLIRALQSQITGAGFAADGAGVRVCIVDTGIDSDSIMYSTRIDTAAGRDFVNNDNNPEDDAGHGSHVAGTAVGGDSLTVNFGCVGSEPFHGVAPRATLIGIKVLNANGSGSFSDVIAGINYGADQSASGGRCDVINMSLGGGAFSGTCDGDSAAAAANAAVDAGVVVVSSSGNDANTNAMGTPACASKVIAVGATYDDSFPNCEFPSQTSFTFCTCAFITCCGTCTDNAPSVDQIGCYSNRSTELDVVAPGCITFSTDIDNSLNGIVGFCGTSMASPHVAGLAALLLSADSSLTPAEVRQAIRDGAIDLGSPGFDSVYGHGRIDAINSLALIGPGCSVPGDCDDLNPCTVDDCVGGSCSNTPIDCDDSDACTSDSCSGGVCVNDTINCDDGDACTNDSCDAGTGCVNDPVQCLPDEVCVNGVCEPLVCDNDGICESGENCNNCSNDCFGGSGGFCGDGICAGSANGEDCFSCDLDCRCAGPGCNACCGDGFCGNNGEKASNCPVDCDAGFVPPNGGSCCGDGTCEGGEDEINCAVDCAITCGVPADCDDGIECTDDDCIGGMCESTPNDANCPDDGLFCNGSEFCDAASDCSSDGDPCPGGTTCNEATDACDPDPCLPSGSSCSVDEDCCSNKCKNGTCRGN